MYVQGEEDKQYYSGTLLHETSVEEGGIPIDGISKGHGG